MSEHAATGKNRRLSQRRPAKLRVKAFCRRGGLDLGTNLALSVLHPSENGIRPVVS